MSIDWKQVKRVLVVRLRSIGDTVLATPSLIALSRYLPGAEIDILLEDWVAPLLEGFKGTTVIATGTSAPERLKTANFLRSRNYDVVFNLHGGTTSSIFVRATGAKYRLGLSHYRYKRFYNEIYPSAAEFWGTDQIHSAEQQLALLGLAGIPVDDKPASRLAVTEAAARSVNKRLGKALRDTRIALIHPAAAFDTKQWPADGFARVAEHLTSKGFHPVVVVSETEAAILSELKEISRVPISAFNDLTLPEVTALASKASIFVGNDSGIAHIAAAAKTPVVVIFGSSNRVHWRPWTDAPSEVVYSPRSIKEITPESVCAAIDRVLTSKA